MVERFKSNYIYNFNQDFSYFIYGVHNLFKVYRTIPFEEITEVVIDETFEIIKTELSHKSNLVLILACNKFNRLQSIYLYDFSLKTIIFEVKEIKQKILNIKLKRDFFIIHEENNIFSSKICIFKFPEIELIHEISAYYNPNVDLNDILSVNNSDNNIPVIAFKSNKNSLEISIDFLNKYIKKELKNIHNEEICVICLSPQGDLVASYSTFGKKIRIFSTKTLEKLIELLRGTDYATIYTMAFDNDLTKLTAFSSHGTIHVFPLDYKKDFNNEDQVSSKDFSMKKQNLIMKAVLKLIGEKKSLHKRKDLLNIPSICGFFCNTFVMLNHTYLYTQNFKENKMDFDGDLKIINIKL